VANRFNLAAAQLERARDLHKRAIVIDGLISSVIDAEGVSLLENGGITASNYTSAFPHHDLGETLADLVRFRRTVEGLRDRLDLATSAAEIERTKKAGKTSLIMGLQHAPGMGEHPEIAQAFHRLGARVMQVTYNEESPLGYSCLMPEDRGLTDAGRAAVAAWNDARILIDLSHVGDRTSHDVIEASTQPVAFTHANPRSFCESPRNKPDAVLRRLAERGGVIGACCWGPICWTSTDVEPTIETFLDVIAHTINIVGIDHVGIATDLTERRYTDPVVWDSHWGPGGFYPGVVKHLKWYTFTRRFVEGLDSSALMPHLTEGLVSRGYTDDQILKILGGNFMRLFRDVWGG
jgi:membrane dipeptidase